MRYGITSDGILLVFQGEEDLFGMLEMINWGVGVEEIIPHEEHNVQEGPELDFPVMACVLDEFSGPKAEVEPQLDQISSMPGLGVVAGDFCVHDQVGDAQGGGFFPLD